MLNKKKKNIGSIQMKKGKTTILTRNGRRPFSIAFVLRYMNHARLTIENTAAGELLRLWISELNDPKAIPDVVKDMKLICSNPDKLILRKIAEYCQWLGYVKMFANIKTS